MTQTESTWHDRVAHWRASGLTADAFAQQKGTYEGSTLRYWSSRLRRLAREAAATAESGEPLRLLPVQVRIVRDLEVRVGSVVVSVPDGVDVDRAAALVRALQPEAS
jgi:hypothetical protein